MENIICYLQHSKRRIPFLYSFNRTWLLTETSFESPLWFDLDMSRLIGISSGLG